ncbi:MAG: hypothetical protein E7609_06595 [Ruminococcaceae bacterium]|nr:hypothetical protein [Oscillospiraceae bacterium]
MKARRLAILALTLVTVVTMGIGYAALNDALHANGSGILTKSAADDAFDGEVYYTGTPSVVNCTAEFVTGEKPDTVNVTIDDTLAIVGDTATCTVTVKNDSAVPATIVTNTSQDSDHFRVTAEYPSGNSIAAGAEIEVVIKIVLKQTVAADFDEAESFGISFNVSSAG